MTIPRLEALLDALADEAPEPVARGRLALGRALGWTGHTTWPDAAWAFSGLAAGQPVELVWRPGRPGLFWTAEPAAPEMDRRRRFGRALAVLRANGAPLSAPDRALAACAFAAASVEWPVFVAGRHHGAGDAAKLYVHSRRVAPGFDDLAAQMRPGDAAMMMGVGSDGLRELYWDHPVRRVGDLWSWCRCPHLAPLAAGLDARLRDWTGQGLDDAAGGRIGLSLCAAADGRPVAFAAFLPVRKAGGAERVRHRMLDEGGAANPALATAWAAGDLHPMMLTLAVTVAGPATAIGLRLPGLRPGLRARLRAGQQAGSA